MKRPSSSVLMAIGVTVAVVVWMVSGFGRTPEPIGGAGARAVEPAKPLPRVSVQTSRARMIVREVVVSARTEPNRTVELKAETEGRVIALGAQRGAPVASGERIVGLDMRDRQARLEEARALIAYAELQFKAAQELRTEQFVSEAQMAELLSRVVAARASLEEIELEVANTNIVAPFDAVLQEREVELGDYVNSGDTVAYLVDTDPLIVVGEVGERDVHELVVGGQGFATLVNGEPIEGRVRYVAPVADANTRTFRIELAVANDDASLRAGMTAELRLEAEQITAHSLSAALLTLDDAGTLGVKSVDAEDRVVFYPIEVVSSSDEGVLVTGLPDELLLITVGQGFVRPGDRVAPTIIDEHAGLSDSSLERATGDTQAKR